MGVITSQSIRSRSRAPPKLSFRSGSDFSDELKINKRVMKFCCLNPLREQFGKLNMFGSELPTGGSLKCIRDSASFPGK